MIDRRPRAPVARSSARCAIAERASWREHELDRVVVEEALVLLDERVLRLEQDADQILLVERVDGRHDGEAADELGDEPVGDQVLGHHLREEILRRAVLARAELGAEADRVSADAALDDLVEVGERPTADEQDVRRVDRQELLVRVLAPTLGRHARNGALEDLEQRLLDTLAAHVARDRRVVGLARDLVDLVDVDDPGLGLLHVEVGGLDQLQQDVLDVLADVAGLGQRRGVGDGERHVQDPAPASGRAASCRSRSGPGAGCSTWRAPPRSRSAPPSARACSGCRPPPTACASPPPGRRRSRSGRRRSPSAWAGCRDRAGREWSAPRR